MPFAFLSVDPNRVVALVINCLAVGGGFLGGFLLIGAIAKLLDKWFFLGNTPQGVHKVARMVGGIGGAVLVALFVFGSGTGGDGPGGDKPGTGTIASGTGTGTPTTQATPDTRPTDPPVNLPPDAVPPDQRVRVTLLGGDDVKDEKFYLLDDDRTPRTFADLTVAVKAKKDASAKPLGVEIRFAPNNTLPRAHPAVLRLANWCQTTGLTVSFPSEKR